MVAHVIAVLPTEVGSTDTGVDWVTVIAAMPGRIMVGMAATTVVVTAAVMADTVDIVATADMGDMAVITITTTVTGGDCNKLVSKAVIQL